MNFIDKIRFPNRNKKNEEYMHWLSSFKKKKLSILLKNIINDKDKLSILVSNSFIHENGFYKITLFEDIEKDMFLRMHLWFPNDRGIYVGESDIHDHTGKFISYILTGRIKHQIYQMSNNKKTKYFKYDCYPLNDKKNILSYEEDIFMKCINTEIFYKNEIYSFNSDIFHTVNPLDRIPTATLCLRIGDKEIKNHTSVFKNKKNINSSKTPTLLSKIKVVKDLSYIITVINNF